MDDQTPMAMELDFTGPFSANELVAFGDLSIPLEEIAAGATGRAIRAVAWVIGRRTNPALTLEQAGEFMVTLERREA